MVKIILKMMVPKIILIFQSMCKYFKKIDNTDHISSWKSKGLSDEIIKPTTLIIVLV